MEQGETVDLIIEHPILSLEPGQVLTLNDAQGVRIRATSGTVWVTYEGQLQRHDREAGPHAGDRAQRPHRLASHAV